MKENGFFFHVYNRKAGKEQDGYFGNPFRLRNGEQRGTTIEKHKAYFYERLETDCGVQQHVRIGKISEEEEHLQPIDEMEELCEMAA